MLLDVVALVKVRGDRSLMGLLLRMSTTYCRSGLGLYVHTRHSRHDWKDMDEDEDYVIVVPLGYL